MKYIESQYLRAISLIDKEVVFNQDKGWGVYSSAKRSYILENSDNNLYPKILDGCKLYFKENAISWWGGSLPNHPLSSQVACLNHLFFLRDDEDAVLSILKEIDNSIVKALKIPTDKYSPAYIQFEAVSEDDFLNEGKPTRGSNCTSIDALMYGERQNGENVLFLIEWKYTENYNRDDKAKDQKGEIRQKRYTYLINNSQQLKHEDHRIYYFEPFYQLMRQTLWAEQVVAHKEMLQLKADDYFHIHVVPNENEDLLCKKYFNGENMEITWKNSLQNQEKYTLITPQNFLKNISRVKYQDLINYLEIRYWSEFLPSVKWIRCENIVEIANSNYRSKHFSRSLSSDLLQKLKSNTFFSSQLLKEIKIGLDASDKADNDLEVEESSSSNNININYFLFPAIRNESVDFYWNGGKLFSFTQQGFITHNKYASVLVNDSGEKEDYISENALKNARLISNFSEQYKRIKENCSLYSGLESFGVSRLYSKYSCIANAYKSVEECPYVVLDIEISFQNKDRIDMLVLNRRNQSLHFVEAKHFSNKEIFGKTNQNIKVIKQITSYKEAISRNKAEILEAYKNHITLLNILFDTSIELPQSLDEEVSLLIFGFDDDQKKGRLKKTKEILEKEFPVYCIGNIKSCDLKNLFLHSKVKSGN